MALKFSNHNSVSNFWSIPMSWETCYPALIIQLSESSSSSCVANPPWKIRNQHSIEWKKKQYTYKYLLHFRVKRNKHTSPLEINMDVTGFKCMFNKDIFNFWNNIFGLIFRFFDKFPIGNRQIYFPLNSDKLKKFDDP